MSKAVEQQFSVLRRCVVQRCGPDAGPELDAVLAVAERVHRGMKRRSGEPYISHPIEVATYVNDWNLPLSCVKAAIAHDIPDVTNVREFEDQLGPTVVAYVLAVSTLFAATAADVDRFLYADSNHEQFNRHVAMIKVADRLHNARTWQYVPLRKAHIRARENLAAVAPAAAALSIPGVAEELRALSTAALSQPMPLPSWTASSLLTSAVQLLPASERERYRAEWEADLRHAEAGREQRAMTLGMLYSAIAIRRQSRR